MAVEGTAAKNANAQPVVIVTAGGLAPYAIVNALSKRFSPIVLIEEEPESKRVILRRRAARLGWPQALGQLATMVASRLGKSVVKPRIDGIMREYGLSGEVPETIRRLHVSSVNSQGFLSALEEIAPAVVLTISCRLLSAHTLAAITSPVINLHSGINPGYRGQMGCYWALVRSDAKNFGATVHLVDKGVDTGGTLYEVRAKPSKLDTISTYPLLVTAASIDIVSSAVRDAIDGKLAPFTPQGRSEMHYPPPIWTYLWNGLTKGIW